MSKLRARNEEVGKILVEAKVLTKEGLERCLKEVPDEYLEDAAVYAQVANEADILKALSTKYKVKFLTSEKLKVAEIPQPTLTAIPKKMAETLNVFPVMFDSKTGQLSFLTSEPADRNALEQVRLASGLQEVRPFLARPSAIRAAISKFYSGNLQAFSNFDNFAQKQIRQIMQAYEERMHAADGGPAMGSNFDPFENAGSPPPAPKRLSAPPRAPTMPPGKMPSVAPAPPPPPVDLWGPTVDLCNVLVSLLESGRGELRGHSSFVARLMRRLTEKLKLDPDQTAAFVLAAHMHDIGKMGSFHLTTFNASEFSGHKLAAQKTLTTPVRLIESVKVPPDTARSIQSMYERWDGKGFPDGLKGKDIPLGARLLAIVDSYADFNQNPRNSQRKVLSASDTVQFLSKHRDTIFDGHLVDMLGTIVLGDDVKARILQSTTTVLILDVDTEETTVLELRLLEQGFDVQLARSIEQAQKILSEHDVDLVVSEIELQQGGDGLKLLADIRQTPKGKDISWVAYTRKSDSATIQKIFELSADFIPKPSSIDVLSAKIKMLVEQRVAVRKSSSRGVSGSLAEMGLPDLIQVLNHGRKSGKLHITGDTDRGEIHIDGGKVVHALFRGKVAEEAFFAMLRLKQGEFELDPTFKPKEKTINVSSEALLLEGMRRLDEGV